MNRRILVMMVFLSIRMILSASGDNNPFVIIKTDYGDITVEIYADKAPVTSANFLRYVDSSLYRGSYFYRVVRMDNQQKDAIKIEVIQGGRWQKEGEGFVPVAHENTSITGVLHKDGVISMARLEPGSATSEFFICVGNQPELDFGGRRNSDGQGFAAFGKVVQGMEIVRKIHDTEAPGQYLERKILISDIIRK